MGSRTFNGAVSANSHIFMFKSNEDDDFYCDMEIINRVREKHKKVMKEIREKKFQDNKVVVA